MKDNQTVITSDAGMEYEFIYDYSIWSCDPKDPHYVGQERLYEMMGRPLLNSAFEGYNTCLFAYGQVIQITRLKHLYKKILYKALFQKISILPLEILVFKSLGIFF